MVFLEMIAKGIGVAVEIKELAQRLRDPEQEVTPEEVEAVQKILDSKVEEFLKSPASDYEEEQE